MSDIEHPEINNIFNKINSVIPEITKSEKKVAQLVLDERENITNMTILDISQAANVSEASVIRFCNKMGFKRLIDFKIQIAKDASSKDGQSTSLSLTQEDEFLNVIRNTASLINASKIKEAVDMIESSEQLFIFGIAASGISARVAEDCFQRMGISASAVSEDHFQIFKAARMTEKDMVIALSLSGNTKDIYEACILAKKNKAKLVTITSYPNSHIARIADVVLLTSAKEDLIDGGKITGYVSQLFVIEELKREYANRHNEEVSRLKELIGTSIISKKI